MLTKVSHDQAAILNLEASILLAEGEDKQARDKLEVALSLETQFAVTKKARARFNGWVIFSQRKTCSLI